MVSALALSTSLSLAAQDVVHAVEGTVKKVDAGTKTLVVDGKDGTEHTFHYASDVTVDGAKDAKKGTLDAAHGVEEGSKVAVHYTVAGGKETAHEVDRIGDDDCVKTRSDPSQLKVQDVRGANRALDGGGSDRPELQHLARFGANGKVSLTIGRGSRSCSLNDDRYVR